MTKNLSYSFFDNDNNMGCVVEKLGNGAISYTHYDDDQKSRGLKFTITLDGEVTNPWIMSNDHVLASETLVLIDQFKTFIGKITGKTYQKPTQQESLQKAYASLSLK